MSEANPATSPTTPDAAAAAAREASSPQPVAREPAPAQQGPRTLAHVTGGRRAVPRARPYLRLLWLIPSAATLAIGLYGYMNVEPGGTVESVKLMTKPGPVGQASEALALVTSTPDLYLKVKAAPKEQWQSQTYKNMAIGNGLIWSLPHQYKVGELMSVDVFNEHTFRKDVNLDHITLGGQWAAEGQTFRVELLGTHNEPPKWALPTLAVGATLSGLVILRFIWDQVV